MSGYTAMMLRSDAYSLRHVHVGSPGRDRAPPVPQQLPPADPSSKGHQVPPLGVVLALDVDHDDCVHTHGSHDLLPSECPWGMDEGSLNGIDMLWGGANNP